MILEPDPSKVRTWTDRSKSFSVEAQFLGVKDGKLNLHKMNGVKIAVPISKMSLEDLEYVERKTGISLDEDKPLSELKKRQPAPDSSRSSTRVGATIEQPKKPEYDWFQFFLTCDVQPGLCERYAQAFTRDSMDESVLPDVDSSVLRNLGLREGDIIKVMRYLDNKYHRNKKGGEEGEGGLFSGPGGTLRNNTRKGRPAPPVETNNVVDLKAFSKDSGSSEAKPSSPAAASGKEPAAASSSSKSGFDDDAWDVKPSKTQTSEPAPAKAPEPTPAPAPVTAPTPTPALVEAPPAPAPAPLTKSMQELSLLTQPLQPEKVQAPSPSPLALSLAPAPAAVTAPTPAAPQIPQPTGATPGFFSGMQPPAVNGQQLPQAAARQRPLAPQYTQGQGALMPPPPSRPLSAPQTAQPSAFTPPPLQPQMTGFQTQVAPPGQSLADIAQQRMQQQYMQQMVQQPQIQQPMMPMMTGIPVQQTGFGVPNQFMPQPTGMMANGPQQPQQPQFAPLPVQQTGFGAPFNQQPLPPQPTGMVGAMGMGMTAPMAPMPTGAPGGFAAPGGFGGNMAPMMPQPTGINANMTGAGGLQTPMQPLVPQKTGPPPPVRFGVSSDAKKLAPQPTGRRANLAAASKFILSLSVYFLYRSNFEANNCNSSSKPLWFLSLVSVIGGRGAGALCQRHLRRESGEGSFPHPRTFTCLFLVSTLLWLCFFGFWRIGED